MARLQCHPHPPHPQPAPPPARPPPQSAIGLDMHNIERLAGGTDAHVFMRTYRRAQAVNSGAIDMKKELVGVAGPQAELCPPGPAAAYINYSPLNTHARTHPPTVNTFSCMHTNILSRVRPGRRRLLQPPGGQEGGAPAPGARGARAAGGGRVRHRGESAAVSHPPRPATKSRAARPAGPRRAWGREGRFESHRAQQHSASHAACRPPLAPTQPPRARLLSQRGGGRQQLAHPHDDQRQVPVHG